jgi:hypothetical protein
LAGIKKFLTANDADITDIQRSRALAFRLIQGINFSSAGASNLSETIAILLEIYKDPFWKPLHSTPHLIDRSTEARRKSRQGKRAQ